MTVSLPPLPAPELLALAELKAPPLGEQAPRVAMNDKRKRILEGSLSGELASVLWKGAPAFDLESTSILSTLCGVPLRHR